MHCTCLRLHHPQCPNQGLRVHKIMEQTQHQSIKSAAQVAHLSPEMLIAFRSIKHHNVVVQGLREKQHKHVEDAMTSQCDYASTFALSTKA